MDSKKYNLYHISQLPIEHQKKFLHISLKIMREVVETSFQGLVSWRNINIILHICGLYHLEEGKPIVVFHFHSHIKYASTDEITVLSGGGSSWLRVYIIIFTVILSRTKYFHNHMKFRTHQVEE